MKLAEIIDLEHQLIEAREAEPQQLRQRDRAIGKKLGGQQLNRIALFLAWLEQARTSRQPSFGERVESAYGTLKLILLLVGVLIGASAASATLAYDGSNPVNVVHFLAVFVGLNALFLLVFLLALLPQRITKWIPGHGELRRLLRAISFLTGKLGNRLLSHLPAEKSGQWQQDWNTLRTRHKLYHRIERWLLLGLTQRFSLAFHSGALVVCLYLIVFSDLAFAWNTTLQISSAAFHQFASALSTPWAALFTEAVPSQELVELSRYFRIEGQYQVAGESARSANPEAVGGWWPFLVLSLITYGLLPRLLTFSLTQIKLKKTLQNVPLDSADFDALHDRLHTPIVETRAILPEKQPVEKHSEYAPAALHAEAKSCDLVLWGEIAMDKNSAQQAARHRFGWHGARVFTAGGLDAHVDEQTTAALTKNSDDSTPVLVLVESWEVPNKALLHFLGELRSKSLPNRPLLIGLVNTGGNGLQAPPDTDDWQTWRDTLADLQDPYLRVEAMVVTV